MMDKVSFEDELDRKGVIVYRNKGRSMLPLIRQDRDLMVIEKRGEKRPRKYDAVLFKLNGKYIMHRIVKVKQNGYDTCGDHMRKKERDVPDGCVIGVLTAVIRDGKTLKATDKKYRLYVHLWCDFFHIRSACLLVGGLFGKIKRKLKRIKTKNK